MEAPGDPAPARAEIEGDYLPKDPETVPEGEALAEVVEAEVDNPGLPAFGSREWERAWKGPRSKVSGLPMVELEPCPIAGDGEHDLTPNLRDATSFGVVLFCRLCGAVAQAEIEAPPFVPLKEWWTRAADKLLKRAQQWYYCANWRVGDLPGGKGGLEHNAHLWPRRVRLGPVSCARKGCRRGGIVVRIFRHPWTFAKIAQFEKVLWP